MSLLNVILFAGLTATLCLGSLCPAGWHHYKDKCFFFDAHTESTLTKNFEFCAEKHAELACVRNQEENDFITKMIYGDNSTSKREHVLGAEQIIHGAKTFRWLDGTLFIYTNWAAHQPVGYRLRNHTYLSIRKDGKWTERGTADVLFHLCQIRLVNSHHSYNKSIGQLQDALADIMQEVSKINTSVNALLDSVNEQVAPSNDSSSAHPKPVNIGMVHKIVNASLHGFHSSVEGQLKNFTNFFIKDEIEQDEKISLLLSTYEKMSANIEKLSNKSRELETISAKFSSMAKNLSPSVQRLSSEASTARNEIKSLKANLTNLRNGINATMIKLNQITSVTNETIHKLATPGYLTRNNVGESGGSVSRNHNVLYVTMVLCVTAVIIVFLISRRRTIRAKFYDDGTMPLRMTDTLS